MLIIFGFSPHDLHTEVAPGLLRGMATLQEDKHFSLTRKIISAWSSVAVVIVTSKHKRRQAEKEERERQKQEEKQAKKKGTHDPVSVTSFKRKRKQEHIREKKKYMQRQEEEEMLLLEGTERGLTLSPARERLKEFVGIGHTVCVRRLNLPAKVQAGDEEISTLIRWYWDQRRFVDESLQNLLTRRLGVVVGEVPKLFEEKMMRDITQCKTQAGSSNWHIHQACGGQIDTVKKTFGLLEAWAFLDMAGFKLPDQILDSAAHKEDDVVAKFAWDFIKHICVNEVKSSSFYHDRPPYMF